MSYFYQHILTYDGTTKVLEAAPAGWEEFTRRFFRHKTYKSVLREDTVAQRFVRSGIGDDGGYQFILNAYEAEGIKAEITYQRKRRNEYNNQFEDDYVGILDLNPDSGFNYDDEFVEVKIIDTSKLSKFIARDEIDINVLGNTSIDDVAITEDVNNSPTDITCKKIDIYLKSDSNSIQPIGVNYSTTGVGEETELVDYEGTNAVNEIGDRIVISTSPADATIYNNDLEQETTIQDVLIQSNTYTLAVPNFISADAGTSWDFQLSYLFKVYDDVGTEITFKRIFIYQESGTGTTAISINESGSYDFGLIAPTLTIPVGGRLDFNIEFITEQISGTGTVTTDLDIISNITSFVLYEKTEGRPDNDIKGYLAKQLFIKELQLITSETDSSDVISSTFLNNSKLFLTSGFQLRQIDKAINCNVKDTFISFDAMENIGLWYNIATDLFIIEEVEQFYKDEAFPFTIDDISDLVISFSTDNYWNQLMNGYPKTEYEQYQGVNEFNNTSEHSSDFTSKNKKNIRSIYYADSIGMELARRKNKDQFLSEDTRYDDKNYIVLTDGAETEVLGTGYTGFAGIDQYYSPGYTPRQNIIKHTNIVSAQYFKDTAGKIKFQKSQKDTDISYSGVNEHDDVEDTEFNTPLIYPEEYTFNGTINKDIIDEIRTDPHRYIPFTDRYGVERYGYIDNVEIQDHKKTAKFVLIRANINR